MAKQSKTIAGDEVRDKTKIIRELELMEGFELSARDFYRRIASDSRFEDNELRETFKTWPTPSSTIPISSERSLSS